MRRPKSRQNMNFGHLAEAMGEQRKSPPRVSRRAPFSRWCTSESGDRIVAVGDDAGSVAGEGERHLLLRGEREIHVLRGDGSAADVHELEPEGSLLGRVADVLDA